MSRVEALWASSLDQTTPFPPSKRRSISRRTRGTETRQQSDKSLVSSLVSRCVRVCHRLSARARQHAKACGWIKHVGIVHPATLWVVGLGKRWPLAAGSPREWVEGGSRYTRRCMTRAIRAGGAHAAPRDWPSRSVVGCPSCGRTSAAPDRCPTVPPDWLTDCRTDSQAEECGAEPLGDGPDRFRPRLKRGRGREGAPSAVGSSCTVASSYPSAVGSSRAVASSYPSAVGSSRAVASSYPFAVDLKGPLCSPPRAMKGLWCLLA
eukprot:148412-Prorocentrum_minimum.AAC.2